MKKFYKTLYLSPLRRWVRKNKIFRFLLILLKVASFLKFKILHLIRENNLVMLTPTGLKAVFFYESFAEFRRVRSAGSEKKIIEPFLRKIRLGDVVFDIGASFGLYAVLAARKVGATGLVIAFEPETQSRERLLRNNRLNLLANLRVFDVALGKEADSQFISVDDNFASGAHLISKTPSRTGENKPVQVFKGDDFLERESLPIPNALKIDVEGMELDVLTGFNQTLKNPSCRVVLCEIHFSNLEARGLPEAPKQINDLLISAGFNETVWLDRSHALYTKSI